MESRQELLEWRERWATLNRVTEREHLVGDAAGRIQVLDNLYTAARSAGLPVGRAEDGTWLRMQALRVAHRARP